MDSINSIQSIQKQLKPGALNQSLWQTLKWKGYMLPKEINSLQHPIVKTLVKLREDKQTRQEMSQVLIVGKKLVAEMAKERNIEILLLLNGEEALWNAKNVYWVNEAILKKVTGLQSPEPYAATIAMPTESTLENKKWIVALDGINDPGNLGTILRSALALDWEGAFLLPGCADPFNEKALRAAKGASFKLPFRIGTPNELMSLSQKNSLTPWVADLEGESLNNIQSLSSGLLILGNEAHGPSKIFKEECQKITIPLSKKMESLNVASAGAILLYSLRSHG